MSDWTVCLKATSEHADAGNVGYRPAGRANGQQDGEAAVSLNQLLVDQPRPEIARSTLSLGAWISAAPHQARRTQAGITVRSAGNKARYRAITDGYTWPQAAQGRGGYSAGLWRNSHRRFGQRAQAGWTGDEERRSAARTVTGQEASHDK
jgi:hypothetical protein